MYNSFVLSHPGSISAESFYSGNAIAIYGLSPNHQNSMIIICFYPPPQKKQTKKSLLKQQMQFTWVCSANQYAIVLSVNLGETQFEILL